MSSTVFSVSAPPPVVDIVRLSSGTVELGRRHGPDGLVDIVLSGDFDAADQYALIDALTAFVLSGVRHMVVDASGVTFADLATMRAIDQVRRFLERSGGSLTVNEASRTVEVLWLLVR